MQLTYFLAAASALFSLVPIINATVDSETGRGMRHHRSYGRYENDYGYGKYYGYGYGKDNDYYYDQDRSHSRHGGRDGYYRYRRNEELVKQAEAAENTEKVQQASAAEQSEGHRYRNYNRHSGRRYYGNYDYDYDYGRHSGRRHRRYNHYYY